MEIYLSVSSSAKSRRNTGAAWQEIGLKRQNQLQHNTRTQTPVLNSLFLVSEVSVCIIYIMLKIVK